MIFATIIVMTVVLTAFSGESCPSIISRGDWGARKPKRVENMTTPVSWVVIHHTYIPGACHSLDQCERSLRAMQNYHMDTQGWDDFGYSFAIGGDMVFEGRGWQASGTHAPGFNNRSIGITFIGDYRNELPTKKMLSLAISLIDCGIGNNYITADYKLIGHRQTRATECPGDALYHLIQTWDHWTPNTSLELPKTTIKRPT